MSKRILAALLALLATVGVAAAGVLPTSTVSCIPGALYGNLNSASVRVTAQILNSCATPITVQVFNAALQPHPIQFVTFPPGEQGIVTYLVPSRGSLRVTPQALLGGTFTSTIDVLR